MAELANIVKNFQCNMAVPRIAWPILARIFIYYNIIQYVFIIARVHIFASCLNALTCACYCLPISTAAAVIGFNGTAYQVSEADGFVEFVFGVLEGELAEGITVKIGFMTVAGTAQGA